MKSEIEILQEIEMHLRMNRDALLTKEVFTGCPCNNKKKKVFINDGAAEIGYRLDLLNAIRHSQNQ